MIYHKTDQWLKTGVEYAHGHASISVVSTHPYSDWCVVSLSRPSTSSLSFPFLLSDGSSGKDVAVSLLTPEPSRLLSSFLRLV